jgi:hypothetical protein
MEQIPITLDELCRLVVSKNPTEGALSHLEEAVRLAEDMTTIADQLIGHFVDEARDSGASWSEIGEHLGVSKQAAQKRFVTKRTRGLFTRFSEEARSIVINAQELARTEGADYIGTEHVVLALIADDASPAARALAAVGASVEKVRAELKSAARRSETPSTGHIPFSADSKKALELSLREAIRAKDKRIGSQHILLGVLRDPKSPGAGILFAHGLTHAAVEEWLDG